MLLDLWEQAYRAEQGIEIGTDNRPLLRQHLYQARAGLAKYDDIVMVLPEEANLIWLVHRNASGFGANYQGNVEPL